VRARATAIALLAGAALGVGACGEDEGDGPSTAAQPAVTAPAAAPDTTATATEPAKPAKLAISKDRKVKPAIPKPTGSPPTELVIQDVVKGKGKAAEAGDNVTVQYVGVSFSTGQEFDASWNPPGKPFKFPLGAQMVIPGWDQGVAGMREGGRRTLIIPPDLGYGAAGQGSIAPNETLVFVIDLLKVR